MRRTTKTPLALAAIAAALGAYIAMVERHRTSTDEARVLRPRLLQGFNRPAVTEIALERTGRTKFLLSRVGGTPRAGDSSAGEWRVMPDDAPAAGSAVATLLDVLDGDSLDIDRESAAPAGTTGLDAPVARLTIATATQRWAIALGRLDASGRGVFVRVSGDPRTLVVGRRLRELVEQDSTAFRERRLLAPEVTASLTALAFESPAQPRRTLRKRSGLWLTNHGAFAARAATNDALAILAALQATAFPPATAASPALPPDRALDLEATAPIRLEIWDQPSDRCAGEAADQARPLARARLIVGPPDAAPSHPPQGICLDPATVQRLWRALDAADQRERHLLMVDPDYADGVILGEADRRLHLRRDSGGGWRITEPTVSYGADARVIGEWLARLAATVLMEPGPSGKGHRDSAPAAGQGRLLRQLQIEGAQPTQLTASRLPGSQTVRVDRAGEGGPLAAPAELFAALAPDPLRFRSRAVLALPRFDVTSLAITTAATAGRVSVRRGPGDTWEATAAAGVPVAVDPTAIDGLLSAMSDLQADRFLATRSSGFEVERTIDFELREGATAGHQRIEITRGCLARLADDQVFEVSATACAHLRRDLTRQP